MTTHVQPIPEGYATVTPYLIIRDAAQAIEFYKKAFNTIEHQRMDMPNGKIGHAEISIGNSRIMLADECPEMKMRGPDTAGGAPVLIHLYVDNVDHVFKQAVKMGAKVIKELADQFYGDRLGCVVDPFGHTWSIATHKEDVSSEECIRRFEALEKRQS